MPLFNLSKITSSIGRGSISDFGFGAIPMSAFGVELLYKQLIKPRMVVFNATIPLVAILGINPQEFSLTSAKVVSNQLTAGGWVQEFWGETLEVMRVSSRSRSRMGKDEWPTKLSIYLLKQMYKLDKMKMGELRERFNIAVTPSTTLQKEDVEKLCQTYIFWRDTLYKGYFNRFTLRETMEYPFLYFFDFDFTVTWSSDDWLRNLALDKLLKQKIV